MAVKRNFLSRNLNHAVVAGAKVGTGQRVIYMLR